MNTQRAWRWLWMSLLSVGILGAYAAAFLPAAMGEEIQPMSGYSLMFWTWLPMYIGWKRTGRPGWKGGLLGAAIGVLAFVLAAFISGLMSA